MLKLWIKILSIFNVSIIINHSHKWQVVSLANSVIIVIMSWSYLDSTLNKTNKEFNRGNRIFAYSSTREQSNKRSGTRLKTESETGERRPGIVRLARFARVRLLCNALPISLLKQKPRMSCIPLSDYPRVLKHSVTRGTHYSVKWCYARRFAKTTFTATQRCNIVSNSTTMFQHCNAVLRYTAPLRIVPCNITLTIPNNNIFAREYDKEGGKS